jgi:hypothetical protein
MKIATYLAIAGIVSLLFGLEFLLAPEFSVKQYGVPADPHVLMLGRYFGGTLLTYGLIFWFARSTRDDVALRALLIGAVVGNLLGVVISAWAGLAALQNAMAWFSVAIYGVLLLGAAYFLTSPTRRA